MKYIFIALLIGCGSINRPEPIKPIRVKEATFYDTTLDRKVDSIKETFKLINVRIDYIGKYNRFKYAGKDYEILYWKTGTEKYRRLGMINYDSANKYADLFNKLIDKK